MHSPEPRSRRREVSTEFYWVAVVAVTIVSAARLTRLATVDKFPPVKAIRDWYEEKTDGSGWQWLTLCGYCFSFWATLPIMVWGDLAGVYRTPIDTSLSAQAWWAFNLLFFTTYLAAMVMARDGSSPEDDD
jgi:hypothetical protein